jgi:hypothetical protein
LIHFLSREAQIYGLLADHAKTAIQHVAESDTSARCLAWYLAGSLEGHEQRLGEWVGDDITIVIGRGTWNDLKEISDSPEWMKAVIRLATKYYVGCRSYDCSDLRFDEAIRPLLGELDFGDCIRLIEAIETNDQTWGRRGAYTDHGALRARALDLNPEFNPEDYPLFNRNLN